MDKQQKIEHLKALIRKERARLDPAVIERAAKAARTPAGKGTAAELVPYDRKSAARAVEIFLKDHPDAARFEEGLAAFLRKNQH